jgi:hypothetical protein
MWCVITTGSDYETRRIAANFAKLPNRMNKS